MISTIAKSNLIYTHDLSRNSDLMESLTRLWLVTKFCKTGLGFIFLDIITSYITSDTKTSMTQSCHVLTLHNFDDLKLN